MHNFVEILMQSLGQQAINELAFRGYFSPWTLEQMQRSTCCAAGPAAAEKACCEQAAPHAE